jgi:4-hydroxy-tetrahydrodipicolinate reductase
MTGAGTALRIGVFGARGRMGQAVLACARERGFTIVAACDRTADDTLGIQSLDEVLTAKLSQSASISRLDAIIDFSHGEALANACKWARAEHCALVSGTTAIGPEGETLLAALSAEVPVMWEPNMSLGVLVLRKLAELATEWLGESFDVEQVEVHHRKKVDAPSGTAVRLAEAVQNKRALRIEDGRKGLVGPRKPEEFGMHAVRGGDVIGDHTLHFLGLGERLELTHRATSRDLFASGALRAAGWIAGKKPGRYYLQDTL